PFQFGITTVAAWLRGLRDAGSGLRGANNWAVSRHTKLIAIRNGEIRRSGSARRRRFKKAMSERWPQSYFAAQFDPTRGAHHTQLLLYLALFLVQAQRPLRALFEFAFLLFERAGHLRVLLCDRLDLGGEPHFGVLRPLRF